MVGDYQVYWAFGCPIDEFVRDAALQLFGCSERAAGELQQLGFTVFEDKLPHLEGFFGHYDGPVDYDLGDVVHLGASWYVRPDVCLRVDALRKALPEPLREALPQPCRVNVVRFGVR